MKCHVKMGFALLMVLLSTACTKTVIVFKPSHILDPLPETESQAKEAKADPLVNKQWNLNLLGLTPESLDQGIDLKGNPNIKVAVLSTGADYNHEDLIGQVLVNEAEITQGGVAEEPGANQKDDDGNGLVDDMVGYDVVDGDGLAYDRHGAGTAVAGIIAAKSNNGKGVKGIMGQVSIYPIRYINDNGLSSTPLLANAMEVAAQQDPDVVFVQNTQLGSSAANKSGKVGQAELAMLKAALEKLAKRNIPVVVGAGDDMGEFGADESEKLLRGFDNVIVVTSVDRVGQLAFLAKTGFSTVTTAAPGESVFTTRPNNEYGEVSGTAYAAAHVTAAIALAKSKVGPSLTVQQISQALLSSDGSDKSPLLRKTVRGGNRLNIVKFLSQVGH